MKIKPLLFYILFYIFVFSILLKNSFSYLDPDLGWHLKIGEEIYKNKAVPTQIYNSATLKGQTWVDHEWLTDLLIYLIYQNFNYVFLSLIFVLFIIITISILIIYTKKYFLLPQNSKKKNFSHHFLILALLLLGLLSALPHLGVRIQELSLFYFLILLYILKKFETTKKPKPLFILPILFFLWANTHGSFLIGIFILFLFLGYKIFQNLLPKNKFLHQKIKKYFYFDQKFNLKDFKNYSIFILLSLLITCFTPYGLELYSFLFEYKNDFYLSHIYEWLPVFSLPFEYVKIFYLILFFILTFLYYIFKPILIKYQKDFKLNFWHLSLTAVFLILTFQSSRHFTLYLIVSLPLYVEFLAKFIDYLKKSHQNKKILKINPKIKFSFYFLILTFFILGSLANFDKTNLNSKPFNNYCHFYPCKAVEFIKNNHLENLKIFNLYGWGGYLHQTLPNKELFIDGRMPQKNYKNHTILEEYYDFFELKNNLIQKKIKEYQIEIFLIPTDPEKQRQFDFFEKFLLDLNEKVQTEKELNNASQNDITNLIEYLNNNPEYQLIYEDETAQIYVKEDKKNENE
jgi:hypothetical protein